MVAFNNNIPYATAASELLASPKTPIPVFFTYPEEPFGDIAAQSGTLADDNPFRFSTKYFSEETGLGYYGLRFYSPELGRWVNRDPIGEQGGIQLYSVLGNNTQNDCDPLGMNPFFAKLGKCAAKLILQEVLENLDEKDMANTSCSSLRKAIYKGDLASSHRWCNGRSVPHVYDFSVNDKTVIAGVAQCMGDILGGKAIDKWLKDLDDESLRKLIEKLIGKTADELTDFIGTIDRDPELKCKCEDADTMECALSATFTVDIDGWQIPLGEEVIDDSIRCSGGAVSFSCCECSFKEKK